MKEEQEANRESNTFSLGMFVGIVISGVALIGYAYCNREEKTRAREKYVIGGLQAHDVNQDGLMDLVDKEGSYYFQTKEGNFISYESVMQGQKAKFDSIYQAKQDSLKRVYESKLEKISGEK